MDVTFSVGLLGALILVAGAAYPLERVSHPARSIKNWLFAVGGVVMLLYSWRLWQAGGPIFFLFLQGFVNVASIFMMFNVRDSIDTPLMLATGVLFVSWSLYLYEGLNTVFFILGLTGIAMGYVMEMGTFRRNAALLFGSALIALFSYVEASWVFFWLNVFFALFSGYYAFTLSLRQAQAHSEQSRRVSGVEGPKMAILRSSSYGGQAYLPLKQRRTPRSSGPA